MAKKILKGPRLIQGKEVEFVLVRSSAYGDHYRRKRGSVKKASLNATVAANAKRASTINNASKPLYAQLKQYGKEFCESMLWQQLLKRAWQSVTDKPEDLLATVTGLELNSKYPFRRFATGTIVQIKTEKKKIYVTLKNIMAPSLKTAGDCYFFEVCLVLFGDGFADGNCTVMRTPWMDKGKVLRAHVFEFERPAKMKYYMVCVKLQSGRNEQAGGGLAGMGVRVMGSARCDGT